METTTTQRYRPIAEASESEQIALQKWGEAYDRWKTDPNWINRVALVAASIDHEKALAQIVQAREIWQKGTSTK